MVDFTGGTWRSLIDGQEVSAIPDSVLKPEESDLDNFDGDTGDLEIVSVDTLTQDNILRVDDEDNFRDGFAHSQSGLNRYPEAGEEFAWYSKNDSESLCGMGVVFGIQDETANNYHARPRPGDGSNIQILKDASSGNIGTTLESEDAALDLQTYYESVVEWHEDGTITLSIYNVDQSDGERQDLIESVTATDSDYSNGGIGFTKADTAGRPVWTDIRVTDIL